VVKATVCETVPDVLSRRALRASPLATQVLDAFDESYSSPARPSPGNRSASSEALGVPVTARPE
jgi:hypothetical protein